MASYGRRLTHFRRLLSNFFIIGGMKVRTTSPHCLSAAASTDRGIRIKEALYFDLQSPTVDEAGTGAIAACLFSGDGQRGGSTASLASVKQLRGISSIRWQHDECLR
jgi:hypothetical protein